MITNPVLPAPVAGSSGNAGVTFLQNIIPAAITLGFIIGVLVFFFMLIVGAIQWISSGGDKQAVESARGKVVNAIIGLIILFAAFAIIQMLNTFFGLELFQLTLPSLGGTTSNTIPCVPDPAHGIYCPI
jgi:hypothetical protein